MGVAKFERFFRKSKFQKIDKRHGLDRALG
jgi:hypothetical protein